jgi:drug/metabolite transporter (DMT)-like permease
LKEEFQNNPMPRLKVGLLLLAGLLTFGFAPIAVRYATDVEPLTLASMRTVFSVLILLPFWFRMKVPLSRLKEKGISAPMMALAGFCLGLHFTFWIASLHYTSVASASVLVTIHPVMLIVAEGFLFKRKFRPLVWAGVLIAFTGSLMLGLADETGGQVYPNPALGNALAFTAAVIFVVYFLIGRSIRQKAEWIDYVFHVYLHAAITCTVLTIIWVGGIPEITLNSIVVGLALAIGPTIIGHGAMNYAVKYLSATLLSTLVLSEAVIAAIAAYFIFGEVPSALAVAAMTIVLGGVGLTWTRRQPPEVEAKTDI